MRVDVASHKAKKLTMVSIFAKSMLKVAMEPLNRKLSYWQWFVKARLKERVS